MKLSIYQSIACVAILSCMTNAYSATRSFSLESGFYMSEGQYKREETTHIYYVPFGVKYQPGSFQFKLTGGWMSLEGPGNIEAGSQSPRRYDESGLSDTFLSANYWWRTPWARQLDFISPEIKVKFPTADADKGLGTGEYDVYATLAIYRVRTPLTLHSAVGYRWRGDRPDLELYDTPSFSLGVAWTTAKRVTIGAVWDMQEPSSALSGPKREMLFYILLPVSKQVKVTPYSQAGFASGSPQFSLGTMLAYSF